MVAIDDGFADAKASKISLMNKFTVVYENSAIKNLPDFEINFPFTWSKSKKWVLKENTQRKDSINGQPSRNEKFKSKRIANTARDLNWVEIIVDKFYKILMKKIVEKRLSKFEESFSQYEEFFEEWKKREGNRFTELDIYISDQDESFNLIQINYIMEVSDTFKGIAKELAPKFLQIVERLEESSQLISEYEHDAPNRYEYFAAKAERSFEEQIKDLLDFSDFYRGYARAYDPNRKLSEVFDNVDSLFQHLEAG